MVFIITQGILFYNFYNIDALHHNMDPYTKQNKLQGFSPPKNYTD
jgi:hypothetical protein